MVNDGKYFNLYCIDFFIVIKKLQKIGKNFCTGCTFDLIYSFASLLSISFCRMGNSYFLISYFLFYIYIYIYIYIYKIL